MFISFFQEPLPTAQTGANAGQKIVDGVTYISEAVTQVSAKPAKACTSWLADQIAPSYWVPNARLRHCGQCQKEFDELGDKHHW